VLAAPEDSRRLYPFLDALSKSQLDVDAPDFSKYPESADVTFHVAELHPGDVLFIPTSWWHYLESPLDDYSISVNTWYGPATSILEFSRYTASLGPKYVTRVFRDFFVHGLLGRAYKRRAYAPMPEGLRLYELVTAPVRKLFHRG